MSGPETERQYDLFSREFKRDPYGTFAAMRREAPVHGHRAPDGTTIWYITRYEDAAAVLRDDFHFMKDVRQARPAEEGVAGTSRVAYQQLINENMLFSDPPDHTRLRALVSQAFAPRRVEEMAGRIEAMANELLDRVAAWEEMDLITEYALPLPLSVITEMLGVPAEDRERVCDWSQAIISPGSRGLNFSARKRKVRALVAYLRRMFVKRQRAAQDDLVTALVQAEEAGDRLAEEELFGMVALLLVTGHETTVNLIGNGALALLQHSEELARLRANPELMGAAVEELLRYDGPVESSTTRWAREDVRFRGHLIRRGEVVRVALASANRDAEQFAEADRLDVGRADNRHLAFGLGIHYCLGAPLARLEGRIALGTLFNRWPNLRLQVPAEELVWRSGVLFRGVKELPVGWGVGV